MPPRCVNTAHAWSRDISHNEIAQLCRQALEAHGLNPADFESAIYQFSASWNGQRVDVERYIVYWSAHIPQQSQELQRYPSLWLTDVLHAQ